METMSLVIEQGPDKEGDLVHSLIDVFQELDRHWAAYASISKSGLQTEKQTLAEVIRKTYELLEELAPHISEVHDSLVAVIDDPERIAVILDRLDFELIFSRHHLRKMLK